MSPSWFRRHLNKLNTNKKEAQKLYKPLNADHKEVRLVTLSPGRFRDDIHCSLSKVSLLNEPFFEALSYVWGVDTSGRRIFLDGIRYTVTDNLEIALRYLRYTTEPRVLWIDALCINQTDIKERNTQVLHMDSVYRDASRVIAWLGEEDNDSDLAFDAFENLPTDERAHWDPQNNPALDKKFLNFRYTSAMKELLNRPWWTRVWTVQESGLGDNLEFVCGNRHISADTLSALERASEAHSTTCCGDFIRKLETENSLIASMNILEDLRQTRNGGAKHRLVYLLAVYRSRQCIDPRDKVYGLLGLCDPDQRSSILIDYRTPIADIYEQVTLNTIERAKSLEIFTLIFPRSFKNAKSEIGNLPSWVLDWTAEGSSSESRDLHLRRARVRDFNSSPGSRSEVRFIEQGKIGLRGTVIDSIAAISTQGASNQDYVSTILVRCKEWRRIAGIDIEPNRSYATKKPTTYYDAYWQTICSSFLPNDDDVEREKRTSDHSTDHTLHDAWWKWITTFVSYEADLDLISTQHTGFEIDAFNRHVATGTSMRKLFLTDQKGFLGLGLLDAKVGDKIVLLEGGGVPYILRPRSEAGTYELVGDAYVHGIMDGEGWNADNLEEIVLV